MILDYEIVLHRIRRGVEQLKAIVYLEDGTHLRISEVFVSGSRRCCINVVVAKFVPFPRDLSPSFYGIGHGFRDPHHAIEHRTSQPRFRFLVLLTSRTQLPPNALFVAA